MVAVKLGAWEVVMATGHVSVGFDPPPGAWSFPYPDHTREELQAALDDISSAWQSRDVTPLDLQSIQAQIEGELDRWAKAGWLRA